MKLVECINPGAYHNAIDHAACVEAHYRAEAAAGVINTRSCLTSWDAVFRGKFTHDRCGALCPGPDSVGFASARRARLESAKKGGGDERPFRH